MKKIIIVLCIIGTVLTGCSNLPKPEPTPVHPLFSADANKYSLLYVDETSKVEFNHDWMDNREFKSVKKINGRD